MVLTINWALRWSYLTATSSFWSKGMEVVEKSNDHCWRFTVFTLITTVLYSWGGEEGRFYFETSVGWQLCQPCQATEAAKPRTLAFLIATVLWILVALQCDSISPLSLLCICFWCVCMSHAHMEWWGKGLFCVLTPNSTSSVCVHVHQHPSRAILLIMLSNPL